MNSNTQLIHVSDLPKDLPEIEGDPRVVMTKDLESGGMVQLEDPPFSFSRWWKTYWYVPKRPKLIMDKALVVTGPELANFDAKTWKHVLSYDQLVFARTQPEQKLRIVKEAQKLSHIVAVTGDGVNDGKNQNIFRKKKFSDSVT